MLFDPASRRVNEHEADVARTLVPMSALPGWKPNCGPKRGPALAGVGAAEGKRRGVGVNGGSVVAIGAPSGGAVTSVVTGVFPSALRMIHQKKTPAAINTSGNAWPQIAGFPQNAAQAAALRLATGSAVRACFLPLAMPNSKVSFQP
ncbi:MAG: hypothetical protein R2838_19775 [Caldilineaceae bacterium]